ncbi:MAG: hypothetical protein AB1671_12890 [Thermodesulfobacteriota bacterium]|jgi:hypothetical protein
MPGKAPKIELPRFGSEAEVALQKKLCALGGRELTADEHWRADEHYGVSVGGRRFVFRDPAAFYRFEEFVRTEFAVDRAPQAEHRATVVRQG